MKVALEHKCVLITGALGFIGSNLVRKIASDFSNANIVGIDNINDYYDVDLKLHR